MSNTLKTSYADLAEEIAKLDPLPNWADGAVVRSLYAHRRELVLKYPVTPEVRDEAQRRLREAHAIKVRLLAAENRKATKVELFDALIEGIDPLALSVEALGEAIKELRQWAIEKCAVCGKAIFHYPYCDRCKRDTTVAY
jgi:RNA-binding protein YhbY